ncbi:hypothetical protein [Acidocella sp.]|uniref:hypothetical protein n=1 Tax=Acidocella sp. TaxID=50710 RepID=UPI0038D0FDD7
MIDTSTIRDRFFAVAPHLDERGRCSFAAAEARSAGYGGIAAVARATGIAPARSPARCHIAHAANKFSIKKTYDTVSLSVR